MATWIANGTPGTTSASLPAGTTTGDWVIVHAYRSGSTTAPTLAAGWTSIISAGANANSATVAYRQYDGVWTMPTWTNANRCDSTTVRPASGKQLMVGASLGEGRNGSNAVWSTVAMQVNDGTSVVFRGVSHTRPDALIAAPSAHTLISNNGTQPGYMTSRKNTTTDMNTVTVTISRSTTMYLVQSEIRDFTPPTHTQASYRFYADGLESSSTALAAQDTAPSTDVFLGDANLQLRVRLQNTNAAAGLSTDDYQLQYDKNASGSWTTVTTGTTNVAAFASANLTDGGSATNRLGAGTGGFSLGEISETGTVTDLATTASNYTELLYSLTLKSANLANGDVLTFRVLYNGAVTGMTYSVTPTVNVTKVASAATQEAYRFYADGTESGSTALAAQDTATTVDVSSSDVSLQLRTRLQSTSAAAFPSTDDWQLQYEKNASGTWKNVGIEAVVEVAGPHNVPIGLDATVTAGGQSFIGDGGLLASVSFHMRKNQLPTGNITARLFAHSGTYGTSSVGTGSPLAISATVPASTLGSAYYWQTFTFDQTFTLVEGTPYVIALWNDQAFDANNYIVAKTLSGSVAAGNRSTVNNSGIWTSQTIDMLFQVNTIAVVSPYNSANLTDTDATTNRLTGGSGTFTAGKLSENGLVRDTGWPGNNHTELLYSLTLSKEDNINGDVLRFRVLRNGATDTMTYGVTPTLNVTKTVVPLAEDAYRFYAPGSESGATASAAQNTQDTVDIDAGDVLRTLRIRVQSTSATEAPSTSDWQLQWNKNNGAWSSAALQLGTEALLTSSTGPSNSGNLLLYGSVGRVGQSFLGDGKVLTKAVFQLDKGGTPPGNLTAYLYAYSGAFGVTGGVGTGSPLAVSSSSVVATSVVSGGGLVTFTFSDQFILQSGTPYVIAVGCDTTTDSSNCVTVEGRSGASHAGNSSYTTDGSSWTSQGIDLIFELYTTAIVGGVRSYDDPALTDGAATTSRLTGGTGTFEAGEVSETGIVTDLGLTGNNFTELLFPIKVVASAFNNNDVIRFRVLRNGSLSGITFTEVPSALVFKTVVGPEYLEVPFNTTFADGVLGTLTFPTMSWQAGDLIIIGVAISVTNSGGFNLPTCPGSGLTFSVLTAYQGSAGHTAHLTWKAVAPTDFTGDISLQRTLSSGAMTVGAALWRCRTHNATGNTAVTQQLSGVATLALTVSEHSAVLGIRSEKDSVVSGFTGTPSTNLIELEDSKPGTHAVWVGQWDDQPAGTSVAYGVTAISGTRDTHTLIEVLLAPEITQEAYRFYADGTETGSTALAAQDTPINVDLSAADLNLQLRTRMQSTNTGLIPATTDWQLQYQKNSDAWANVGIGNTEILYQSQLELGGFDNVASAVSNVNGCSQSFQGGNFTLTKASFTLSKQGTIQGTFTAALYAATGALGSATPTGSALATSTTTINANDLTTTEAFYDFNFSGYSVGTGVYCIVLEPSGITGTAGDFAKVSTIASGSHPGVRSWKHISSGIWTATPTGTDYAFRVYGIPAPTAVYGFPSTNLTDGAATTNRLTGGTGTFVAGEVTEDGLVDDLGFSVGNYTELLYSLTLEKDLLTDGDTVKLRVLRDGSINELTYSAEPTIAIGSAAPPISRTFFPPASWDVANDGSRTVTGLSWTSGDRIVVIGMADDAGGSGASFTTPTNANLTFAAISGATLITGPSEAPIWMWDAVASTTQTGQTITSTFDGPTISSRSGLCAYVVTGGGTPRNATTSRSEAAQSLTVGVDSLVLFGLVDWNASAAGRTQTTGSGTATEQVDGLVSGQYMHYVGDWNGVSAGTFNFGITDYTSMAATQALIEIPLGPKTGSATAAHTWSTTATGKKVMQGAASAASHTWSPVAQGRRPMKGSATSAHTWSTTAAGKRTMKGTATSAHTWSTTATGARTMRGTTSAASHVWSATAAGSRSMRGSATSAHAWSSTATGFSPAVPVRSGTAAASWQAAVGSTIDDSFNGAVDTTLTSLGYLTMYGGTLHLDGAGNAITKGGWGGVTHPTAVTPNSWVEIAFRLDDASSYAISLLFRMPSASASNGNDSGYSVVITELGFAVHRLGVTKNTASQTLTNTQDYVVRAEWTGGVIKVFLGGTEILAWTDPSPLTGTYVGLYLDNNYVGTSDKLRYLRAGTAAVGQTPMQAAAGSATATHLWSVSPAQGFKPLRSGPITVSHLWTVTAAGKREMKGQGTTAHTWTISPSSGVAPVLGVKQGTAVAQWAANVSPSTGRASYRGSATASHLWTVSPASGRRTMKGSATSSHTWTVGPATGKRVMKGQATSTHTWTVTPAQGRRVTFGQATAEHLWRVNPATGVTPILGVSQGTAVAVHTWTIAPATGKRNPIGQATAAHTWTLTAVGKRFMRGSATSAHTWTISPATGKRFMRTAQVTSSHLWAVTPSSGKRFMRGQATSTHTWNTFPATGVTPILGVKQGTAVANHTWSTTATGKKVVRGNATAAHVWATTGFGVTTRRGSATAAHLWTIAPSTGKRILRSGQVTATHLWTVTPSTGSKPLRGQATAAHLWTLSAQGVRPVLGVKQGSAVAVHSWTVSPATGRRIMRGAATSSHLWVATPVTGKRFMRGGTAATHMWVPNATGRMQPIALATVIHVWRPTAQGFRVTFGSVTVLYQFNINTALGSPGVVGVIQGIWDGWPVVAMQYGTDPVFECLMVEP